MLFESGGWHMKNDMPVGRYMYSYDQPESCRIEMCYYSHGFSGDSIFPEGFPWIPFRNCVEGEMEELLFFSPKVLRYTDMVRNASVL